MNSVKKEEKKGDNKMSKNIDGISVNLVSKNKLDEFSSSEKLK